MDGQLDEHAPCVLLYLVDTEASRVKSAGVSEVAYEILFEAYVSSREACVSSSSRPHALVAA